MKFQPLITGFLMLFLPGLVAAQVPDNQPADNPSQPQTRPEQTVTEVLINQPYSSKTLGEMTLPFMWTAVEDEKLKRLVITESRSTSPAVITVDLVAKPGDVDIHDVSREIASSIAESLGTNTDITGEKKTLECGKKKCPSVDVFKAAFSGTENEIPRSCAIQVVPAGKNILVLTICAFAQKKYSPELPAILDEFFRMMK